MAYETELKFEVENYEKLAKKLLKIANFISSAYELTIMYDENGKLFKKDARLRLRKIVDIRNNMIKIEMSYKKPKTREGVKIEEEYEVEVSNFDEIEKILNEIGFEKVESYERIRDTFEKEGVKITIDSFPFGDYIEIEGDIHKIKQIAKSLGFDFSKNITKSCDDIYVELCQKEGKELKDFIVFENKEQLEKLKQKRDFLLR